MTEKEWLQSLKAGDKVVVTLRQQLSLKTIERVTQTQIVVQGERFNRDNGELRGADWYFRSKLVQPTPELLQKIRRAELLYTIRPAVLWDTLSDDQLERIVAIMKERKGSTHES